MIKPINNPDVSRLRHFLRKITRGLAVGMMISIGVVFVVKQSEGQVMAQIDQNPERQWPPSTDYFDPLAVTLETFRIEDLNQLLMFLARPGDDGVPISSVPDGVTDALSRLFPPGTPVDEFTAFLENDAAMAVSRTKDNNVKRITKFNARDDGTTVHYVYNFVVPGDVLEYHIENTALSDLQKFNIRFLSKATMVFIIKAKYNKDRRIDSFVVKVKGDAL